MLLNTGRGLKLNFLLLLVVIIFTTGCIISLVWIPTGVKDECECNVGTSFSSRNSPHLLGVLVPFRDRFEELLEFAPHMHKFLAAQGVDHRIYIINQVDQYRFNRASLINVGFKMASADGCDYMVMHDVDLLPLNPALSYSYPSEGRVFHVASPEFHPKYHYPKFVGGILVFRKEDFIQVNGMSNKYWGWGLEDDEFFVRLKEVGINVTRPTNLSTGIENTFKHNHDRVWRKRDMAHCFNQKEVTRRRDRTTGLNNVAYEVKSRVTLKIDEAEVSVVNTILRCNRTITPWCLCSEEKMKQTMSDVARSGGRRRTVAR